MESPEASLPVPKHITDVIGDGTNYEAVALRFFDAIQGWMPFVSKKRFCDLCQYPLVLARADLALLVFCMHLVAEVLPEETRNPQTPTYFSAKQFYLEVEAAGFLSIQVLQAGVLISLYELGHAIYPSAYLSIGACARYAYALGINRNATSQFSMPFTWIEQEERRRAWWAIVILDRCENPMSPSTLSLFEKSTPPSGWYMCHQTPIHLQQYY
jgi:hypothetical protein